MLFKEMMNKEREAGRQEGLREGLQEGRQEGSLARSRECILALLGQYGSVPKEIVERINAETDSETLNRWLLDAAKATSFETFLEMM